MKHIAIFAAICMLAVSPLMTHAETYWVSVETTFFEPNDLVIHPGDTVVWTDAREDNEDGCSYGCPPVIDHNVAADNQSFSSGMPDDGWTFEQTFDDPGEIFYHCEQHSSAGKDINIFMNGRITVMGDEEGVFQINPGLSDAWYNPDTAGQGFFIIVFAEIGKLFLAWFTYEVERPDESVIALLGEAGHRWLTALGDYSDNQAALDIFVASGGIFNASPPAPDQEMDGEMIVEFSNCNEGTVSYNIASIGQQGVIPIQRITLDKVPLCEALEAQLQQAQ